MITADIGGGKYFNNIYVDDLYVTAELKPIDGTGGILGQSGPTAIWSGSELTEAGLMQFDTADAVNYLSKGLWDDIVTHEMMHVLGFGTLWNYGVNPLVPTAGQYIGAQGLAAYQAAGHLSAANFSPRVCCVLLAYSARQNPPCCRIGSSLGTKQPILSDPAPNPFYFSVSLDE